MRNEQALNYIESVMSQMNCVDSVGKIILQNGMMIIVENFFDYFLDVWAEYQKLKFNQNPKQTAKFIQTETVGGIISNGTVSVHLADISFMLRD